MSFIRENYLNSISGVNSTTSILLSDEVFSGESIDVLRFSTIEINIKSDVISATNGLKLYFGPNGTNWDYILTDTYSTAGDGFNQTYNIKGRYFKIEYTNSSTDQSYFRLQTILEGEISEIKSHLYAQNLKGNFVPLQTYFNRSLNCTITNPLSAFGELIQSRLIPQSQLHFAYYNGVVTGNNVFDVFKNNSSISIVRDSNLILASGPNYGDYSNIQTKKFVKYNSGQGIRLRGSVLFSPIREGFQQAIGFGDKANGFYLYNSGSTISCLKRTGGEFCIYKLELGGTSATSNGLITILLNSIPNYILVTSGDTIIEIVKNIYSNSVVSWYNLGWELFTEGSTIYFKSLNPMSCSGTFTFSTTATGFTSILTKLVEGKIYSEYEESRISWNDICDGTNIMPNINFSLGNIFELVFQWLGYGKIIFNLENPVTGLLTTINTIDYANTSGKPSISNPNGYIIAGSQNTRANISSTFTTTEIDTINNTITISEHQFSENDFIIYDNNSNNGIIPTTYTKSFDGSDNSIVLINGENCIIIEDHKFKNSEQVIYSNGGGTDISGLTNNSIYYIIYRSDNIFQLASSLSNVSSFTSISISAVGTGISHTLSSFRYYIKYINTDTVQLKTHFNDTTSITLSSTGSRILKLYNSFVVKIDGSTVSSGTTITKINHGLLDLECVRYVNYSGGAEILGLTNNDIYYIKVVDDNTFSLTESKNENAIELNAGSGNEHFFITLSAFSTSSLSVFNEGEIVQSNLQSYAISSNLLNIATNNNNIEFPLLALFVKKTYNSKTNIIPITIKKLIYSFNSQGSTGYMTAKFITYLNPTFTIYDNSTDFIDTNTEHSITSYKKLTSTDRITGGLVIDKSVTGLGSKETKPDNLLLQSGDMIVITVLKTIKKTDIDVDCSIIWNEDF